MATWIGSPNYSTGRGGNGIDRIVIHWMVGTLASTDAVFQNTTRGTSAHYGIEDGNIHQYVREEDTAFHAGYRPMNLRSIGIEHSAAPGRDATAQTIETSAQLVADICKRRGIPCDRTHIIKHSEVIPTQCCGTVPIDTIIARANEIIRGASMTTVTKEDLRIIHSELEGWPLEETHSGKHDKLFMDSWGSWGTTQLLQKKWDVNGPWRAKRETAINYYDKTRPVVEAENATLKQQASEHAKIVAAKDKEIADLKAQVATGNGDTQGLNAFGESLRWIIARLGLKK